MLVADTLIKRFTDRISFYAQSTRALASGNLLDQAVLSEGLCRDMASILLQRSFKSTNTRRPNHDTIDLHDLAKPGICVQVTIREDREKIDSTLKNFILKEHYKQYDSIYFFIIGQKPAYDPKKPFNTQNLFRFDPAEHVIALPDMVRLAQSLSIDDLDKLVNTVERHIAIGPPPERNLSQLAAKITLATLLIGASVLGLKYFLENSLNGSVVIPGNTVIERQINRAKVEGASITATSAEFATAVPFTLPTLTPSAAAEDVQGNIVALSNSSPLRPEHQDIVFNAGRCRFLGRAAWPIESALVGRASIAVISCVMHNGDSYGYGELNGPEIGFIATRDRPTDRDLRLVRSRGAATLASDEKYIVRFIQPIHELPFKGKTMDPW